MKLIIKTLKIIWFLLFYLSFIILIINLIGLRYNNYSVSDLQNITREEDTTISYENALNNLNYLKFMRDNNIIEKEGLPFIITNIVLKRMSNLLDKKYCGNNLYSISIFDNWILWVKFNIFDPDYIYEFADPYRALKRGAGFCSQQSMVVAELLKDFGYKAGVMDLEGHVVAWVKSDKGICILDTDYGVIMQFDFAHACSNRKELIKHYKNMRLKMFSKKSIEKTSRIIADIYCKNNGRSFIYKEGVDGYCGGEGHRIREDRLYIVKWAIPGYIIYLSAIGYMLLLGLARIKKY